MTTQRKITMALRFGISATLLSAAVFMSGWANAGQTVTCSASGAGFRQYATVTVSDRDPSVCVRVKHGMPTSPGVPDCWQAVINYGLSCVDIYGRPNIVDL